MVKLLLEELYTPNVCKDREDKEWELYSFGKEEEFDDYEEEGGPMRSASVCSAVGAKTAFSSSMSGATAKSFSFGA